MKKAFDLIGQKKDLGFYKDSLTALFIKHGLLHENETIVRWNISERDFLSIYVEGEASESLSEIEDLTISSGRKV